MVRPLEQLRKTIGYWNLERLYSEERVENSIFASPFLSFFYVCFIVTVMGRCSCTVNASLSAVHATDTNVTRHAMVTGETLSLPCVPKFEIEKISKFVFWIVGIKIYSIKSNTVKSWSFVYWVVALPWGSQNKQDRCHQTSNGERWLNRKPRYIRPMRNGRKWNMIESEA